MSTKIWVGKRESDILTYPYFDISITFWGSNTNNNHSFCTSSRTKSNYNEEFTEYVLQLLIEYISTDKNTEIHFYNNVFAHKLINLNPMLEQYIVNLNPKRVLDLTRHKTLSRVWLQNIADVPSFACLSKSECQYKNLTKKFPSYDEFIIQKNVSGGGEGTYLVNKKNHRIVLSNLTSDDVYLVSPYYKNNTSLSCHLLIDGKNVTVFPISKQLLSYDSNKISYCGNEFIDNKNSLAIEVKRKALIIGSHLMEINYRGICGLDFIFADNKILLIEINPRYQGSSYLINAALKENKTPSLFELNSICFNKKYIRDDIITKINELSIAFESHTHVYNSNLCNSPQNHPQEELLFLDGLPNAKKLEEGVYMYRYLKNTK